MSIHRGDRHRVECSGCSRHKRLCLTPDSTDLDWLDAFKEEMAKSDMPEGMDYRYGDPGDSLAQRFKRYREI